MSSNPPRRRLRRVLLVLVVSILVAAGMLWGVARYFLGTRVTPVVAARLQSAYGGPVHVGEADIGLQSSSLRDVELFEPSPSASELPWIKIDAIHTDLSAWDLVRGKTSPGKLALEGPAVTLRIDKQGHLLTRLPHAETRQLESVPGIEVKQGRISFLQDDRPDFVLGGVDGGLRAEGERLLASGTISDPLWGQWTFSGWLDQRSHEWSASLNTGHAVLTKQMLSSLPFIPLSVWQQVQIDAGETAADITIRYDPVARQAHYRIQLKVQQTSLLVTAIGLAADQAGGTVEIEDGLVRLKDVSGKAAEGEIKTTATLDFRSEPSPLDFAVQVQRLNVRKLPALWHLPPQFGGRLNGQAHVQLTIAGGQVRTSGSGDAEITQAFLGDVAVKEPIKLKLHSDGNRFHFSEPTPQTGSSTGTPLGLLSSVVVLAQAESDSKAGPAERSKKANAPSSPKSPTYLDVALRLDDAELNQLLKALGIKLPFPVAGHLSCNVQASIPINSAGDLKAYRLKGAASAKSLTIHGLELRNVDARVHYTNGILVFDQLEGQFPAAATNVALPAPQPGIFSGTAQIELVPQRELSARLRLNDVPLSQGLRSVPGEALSVDGRISGSLAFHVPLNQLDTLSAWQGTGTLASKRIEVDKFSFADTQANVALQHGSLSLDKVRSKFLDTTILGSGQVTLKAPYGYKAQVTLPGADLSKSQRLDPKLRLPVALEGQVTIKSAIQGALSPLSVNATGQGEFTDLKLRGLAIDSGKFKWAADKARLKLTNIEARIYGGELTGAAELPVQAQASGRLDLDFKDLDAGALARELPALPIRLEGHTDGSIRGTLAAADASQRRDLTSTVELRAASLRVQGVPTERLHGSVNYRSHTVDYQLEGQTLGGRFHLDGQVPLEQREPAEERPPQGHLRIEGARLGKLGGLFGMRADIPLRGRLDAELTFRHEGGEHLPVGNGKFSVVNLRWGQAELADNIEGDLDLSERGLRLRNIQGVVGEGLLNGQAVLSFSRDQRSRFSLAAERVDAASLLSPWPALAGRVEGPVQVRLRGVLGSESFGTGEIGLPHGKVAGLEVTNWRLPLAWAFAPGRGRGQVEVQDSTAQAAAGRLTGRLVLRWEPAMQVDGQIRFSGLQLQTLFHQVTDFSQIGTGQATGKIDLAGKDVRSLDDLTARIDASFGQTQALQFPILQQIAPTLVAGQSSTLFQGGDLRARLARSIVHIERLSFTGTTTQLLVQGDVTLQGRLALDVTATTGQVGPNFNVLRLLGLGVPAAGPIPVGMLMQAGNYLSNRVVHLRVTGTIRSPVITAEPLHLLTQEAFQFFVLNRLMPGSAAAR